MNRQTVYQIIDAERAFQDRTYEPTHILPTGVTREQRDADVPPHLVLMRAYLTKAEEAWAFQRDGEDGDMARLTAMRCVAKITAIGVRALERVAGVEQLLTKGLR